MSQSHIPLLVALVLASGLAGLMLVLSYILGPKRPTDVKSEPFECGNPVMMPAAGRVHVQYYLVALLFLAFDVEAVFIYPWALLFGDAVRGQTAELATLALEMGSFVLIVLVGLAYVWRKGALSFSRGADWA